MRWPTACSLQALLVLIWTQLLRRYKRKIIAAMTDEGVKITIIMKEKVVRSRVGTRRLPCQPVLTTALLRPHSQSLVQCSPPCAPKLQKAKPLYKIPRGPHIKTGYVGPAAYTPYGTVCDTARANTTESSAARTSRLLW